jgi:hypothetical protein
VASPNPNLKEIQQWLEELPTIDDLKKLNGFEIGKAYYFVRIGGRWRIGKENPYIDAKNLASKPDNILCFADGDEVNKRIAGQRDCESGKLHTVKIQAEKREATSLDKLLVKIGLRKEFLEFVWEKTPQEIYEEQIEEYKRSYNINTGFTVLAFILIVGLTTFLNTSNYKPLDFIDQLLNLENSIIDKLSLKYQQLPLNKKKIFLQRTDLSILLKSKLNFESYSFKELLKQYFDSNKERFNDNFQKKLFLEKLLNEINNI